MIAIAILVGVLLLFYTLIYNSLVGKKNQVMNAFAGIDAQLKKRYDLIPNLIASIKQYMDHEKGVLEELTKLRTAALKTTNSDKVMHLNEKINEGLKGIMVSVENYPDLKSSDNFIQLQNSLQDIEDQLAASRRAYNASVTDYNDALEMFPSNIIAGILSYKRKNVFSASEQERKNVNVTTMFADKAEDAKE